MGVELSATVGFAAAGSASLVATPLAIMIARRTGFYDWPQGYRTHERPTPLLGGAAVMAGLVGAAITVGATSARLVVLMACALALSLVGTIDDRVAVAPKWRLLAETIAAVALVGAGLGWNTSANEAIDFVLSLIWIVGLVNAFNLMDNLDGACATVAGVSAAGVGTLAAIYGQANLAGLAFGVCGGCGVFLAWNLARPAKIFLGDGGSMSVGFLVAALAMAAARHVHVGAANLLAGSLLVGLPILDVALVSLSRRRRGVTLMTGGRDHLTHRLHLVLHAPRAVAGVLACGQASLCALAIIGVSWGSVALEGLAVAAILAGGMTVALLDTPRWRPAEVACGEPTPVGPGVPTLVGVDSR